jgi:hypothetical protein
MKCSFEMDSGVMIYILSFMKIDIGVQQILETVMLVLLLGGVCELRR